MPQTPAQPQVIRTDLGTPDAIVVETSSGGVYVLADHGVTDEQLAVITLAAMHVPTADVVPVCVPPQHRRQAG